MVETGTTAYQDADLVAGLRARDESVFARLVDQWGASMQRVARGHVASDAIAEEVVQDTWVAVLRGIDRFEGRSSLRTWVFRILSNTAKTRGIRERRTVPVSSLAPDGDHGPTVDPQRFRDADDPYPGGWKAFPATWPAAASGSTASSASRWASWSRPRWPSCPRASAASSRCVTCRASTPTRCASCSTCHPATSGCSCTAVAPTSGRASRTTTATRLAGGRRRGDWL